MTEEYTPTAAFKTAKDVVAEIHKDHENAVQLLGRGKFDAWTLTKGMTHEVADALYVNCADYMGSGEPLNADNAALLEKIRAQIKWFG